MSIKKPMVLVMAGPNGSGKSTITQYFEKVGTYTNADDIVSAVGDDESIFEVRYQDENIWLTQKMLATLYDVKVSTVNEHIMKIYADSELLENATIRKFRIVQKEGNRNVNRNINRNIIHYNLQMIIAVGFKVNSERAVQFRKWENH